MANFTAGVCPKCNEHLLLKQGLNFLVCPLCAENIIAREANEALEKIYADPAALTENIAQVLRLEKKYGPRLPYQVLLILKKNFPHNEEVAFLTLKMSGYNSFILKEYLTNFAKFQKPVSFAAEVLENGLVPKHWELAPLFEQYIKNKTAGSTTTRFLEKLREMNASIAANPPQKTASALMYTFYIMGSILNIGLTATLIIIRINFAFRLLIALAPLLLEMFVLYRHAKKYGNRLTIPDRERALMVLFMCSIVLVVGGVFVGALVRW